MEEGELTNFLKEVRAHIQLEGLPSWSNLLAVALLIPKTPDCIKALAALAMSESGYKALVNRVVTNQTFFKPIIRLMKLALQNAGPAFLASLKADERPLVDIDTNDP